MANLFRIIDEDVAVVETKLPRGIIYVQIKNEVGKIVESISARGMTLVRIKNEVQKIIEGQHTGGSSGIRKLQRIPKPLGIYESIVYVMDQGTWTDPTYYQTNDIPTTSGTERLNINVKLIDKIRLLFDYLHGDASQNFTFRNNTGADFTVELTSVERGFRIVNSGGTVVFRINHDGEIVSGITDSAVLGVQFPGVQTVQNRVNNVRIPAPYSSVITSFAMVCDDVLPPTGASLTYRINRNATPIGTVSITAGNSSGSVTVSQTLTINDILTYDCTAIGSGFAGQDVHIQARGYRSGAL